MAEVCSPCGSGGVRVEDGDAGALARVSTALASSRHLFPDLAGDRLRVVEAWRRPRPRCSLVRLDVTDGRRTRSVLVKLRHDATAPRAGDHEGRPRLTDIPPLSATEAARAEHAALVRLAAAVDTAGDARFGCVRPLLLLPSDAALVLEFVPFPTLRNELLSASRLHRDRQGAVRCRNAGALLDLYQRAQEPSDAAGRLTSVETLHRLTQRMTAYLRSRGEPGVLLDRIDASVAAALGDLPALTGFVAHGDFAPRNLFVRPDGSVLLFDPMPRWRVPAGDDLGTFLVNLRLSGPQLASRGAYFSRAQLAEYEDALLEGYGRPPEQELRVFVLVALLDRWGWLAAAPGGSGVRAAADAVRHRWLRQEVYREADRLTRSYGCAEGGP